MSWLFSRALVAASSVAIFSDGEPSAPSSSMPMPQACSWRGRTMDVLPRFPCGTTSDPLTDEPGEAALTWCLEASLARTSAPQVEAPASAARAPVSGLSSLASFARFDPATCSWRTPQCSLLGDSDRFSATWPRSGSMRSGECWERPMLAPTTSAIDSGSLLPTPTASEYGSRNNGKRGDGTTFKTTGAPSLATMARKNLWATPKKADGERGGRGDLLMQVRGIPSPSGRYRTPLASDWKGPNRSGGDSASANGLATQVGGQLNPTWVEWLMGWPLGWTAFEQSATDKFQQWRRAHGSYSALGLDGEIAI